MGKDFAVKNAWRNTLTTEKKTMKYKPCCDNRCMVAGCTTRENGGCYCVCRLKDFERSLLSELSGNTIRFGAGMISRPGKFEPLKGEEKENIDKQLEVIRQRLKKYEEET